MARSRNRYSTGLTARTVSVRLGDGDMADLAELHAILAAADRQSALAAEVQSYRGVHDSWGPPLREGQVIRWAIGRALESVAAERQTVSEIPETV